MKVKRTYKDILFRDLFGSRERLENTLELYNALNNSSYTDAADIELTTIDDAIYIRAKNDVSFIIRSDMVLFEHQSTYNPNMVLRGLMYFAELFSTYISKQNRSIYGSSRIELPTPHYYVFYVGTDREFKEETLRLSDSYKDGPGDLELKARLININLGVNDALLEKSPTLLGYVTLLSRVRAYKDTGYKT